MKDFRLFSRGTSIALFLVCLAACLPGKLLAHPGHYHPDETDEFDFFRATFFHSHGVLDYILAAVALGSIATAWFTGRPSVRFSALALATGSLVMLPIL